MRVVHLNETVIAPRPPKKSAKEQRHERCVLLLANQQIKDRKEAQKFKAFLQFRDALPPEQRMKTFYR